MKRALAFLVFGPALAAVATILLTTAKASGPSYDVEKILAVAVFFFTLPVAAIMGCVDGVLHDVPVSLRAALTVAIGGIVTFSLAYILFGWFSPPREILALLAIGGGACMGVCSLLANDFRTRREPVIPGQ